MRNTRQWGSPATARVQGFVGVAAVAWALMAFSGLAACGDDDDDVNSAPLAVAGQDREEVVGTVVVLDGNGSNDPDGDPIVRYVWTMLVKPAGSVAKLFGAETVSATFVPDVEGRYEVQLLVSDGELESEPDTVVITAIRQAGGSGWSLRLGEEGAEEMEGLARTPDGGFVVCGWSDSYSENGDGDALVVRFDAEGNVLWARTFGGTGDDMALDIEPAPNGGYLVSGWTQSFGVDETDGWILKLDEQGEVEWSKTYGGAGKEQFWSVARDADGYVLAGGTTSFGAGGADYWVVAVDDQGAVRWQSAYGGTEDDAPGEPYDEYVARVDVGPSGSLWVGSVSYSFGTGGDVWVLKLEPSDGSIQWEFAYGGPDEDSTWSLSAAPDGGCFVTGSLTDPQAADSDLWVLRLEPDGSIGWQKTYGLSGKFDEALCELPLEGGGLLVGGYFELVPNEDWRTELLKIAPDGSLEWAREYRQGAMSWANALARGPEGFVALGVTAADVSTWDEQLWLWEVDATATVGRPCGLGTDLPVSVRDAQATAVATSAVVTSTSAAVADVSPTVQDVSPTWRSDCR